MPERERRPSPRPLRLLPLACLLLALLAPQTIPAAVDEDGTSILRLDEAMDALRAGGSIAPRSALPADTPVLLTGSLDALGPKGVAAALILSGLSLRANGEIVRAHSSSERERAETRRLPHFVTAPPSGGIETGAVALYGELTPPPYAVEVMGDEIRINGVTVYTYPGPAVMPPSPSAEQVSRQQDIAEGGAEYARSVAAGQGQAARDAFAQRMLAREEVAAARWLSDDTLELSYTDGSTETLGFEPEGREADAADPAAEAEYLDSLAESLRQVLRADHTVLAGATYLLTITDASASGFRRRLDELRGSSEPEALKLARIQVHTGDRNAAADLLYNP